MASAWVPQWHAQGHAGPPCMHGRPAWPPRGFPVRRQPARLLFLLAPCKCVIPRSSQGEETNNSNKKVLRMSTTTPEARAVGLAPGVSYTFRITPFALNGGARGTTKRITFTVRWLSAPRRGRGWGVRVLCAGGAQRPRAHAGAQRGELRLTGGPSTAPPANTDARPPQQRGRLWLHPCRPPHAGVSPACQPATRSQHWRRCRSRRDPRKHPQRGSDAPQQCTGL